MSRKNIAASVWARLKTIAKERGEQPEYVLTRYALERLLYRLSRSSHADRFVLKGACLFALWTETPHRATRDIDFLCHGKSDMAKMIAVFRDVCVVAIEEDDGLIFDPRTVSGQLIKEDQAYEGLRITMQAILGKSPAKIQIDIGFGDAITPGTEQICYPTLLDLSRPIIGAYPKETVVAEKYQAMVHLGVGNSRMKDFFDLQVMSEMFEFDGKTLAAAVAATFERRRTPVPVDTPTALSEEFAADAGKVKQWTAFLRRSKLGDAHFGDVISQLRGFRLPVSRGAQSGEFDQRWLPVGPWS